MILPTYEHGTWADHAVVATRNVVAVSDDGDPLQLAMIGVNPIIALLLLRLHEALANGDWIAQTRANSAVGQYVISSPSWPASRCSTWCGARRRPRRSGPRAATAS